MTWNLRGRASPPLDRAAGKLAEYQPDIVGLQEVQKRQALEVAELAGYPQVEWTLKHRPGGALLWWRAEGLAVLSRHPIASLEGSELSDSALMRSHERRVVQVAEIAMTGGPLTLVNTHLTTGGGRVRHEQATRLAQLLPHDPPAVLVGDLNVDEDPAVFGPLTAAGFHAIGRAEGPTFPAGGVERRLDHILVPAGVRVVDVLVPPDSAPWAELSDHLPVIADLEW